MYTRFLNLCSYNVHAFQSDVKGILQVAGVEGKPVSGLLKPAATGTQNCSCCVSVSLGVQRMEFPSVSENKEFWSVLH